MRVDGTGTIVREAKVASEPEALVAWFAESGLKFTRIGLEAGPLSRWLHAGLRAARLAAILIETRHLRAALGAMKVKTDRNDALGMAQLIRMGCSVRCMSRQCRRRRYGRCLPDENCCRSSSATSSSAFAGCCAILA